MQYPINTTYNLITVYIFQLPYYIDGDIKITQSNAILRYIGRKYGLGMYMKIVYIGVNY